MSLAMKRMSILQDLERRRIDRRNDLTTTALANRRKAETAGLRHDGRQWPRWMGGHGFGWMAGYGGIWLPILLVIAVAGFRGMGRKAKGEVNGHAWQLASAAAKPHCGRSAKN